jgi:hypothetical protein
VEGRVVERTKIEGPREPIMIKIAPPKVIGRPEADARAQAEFEEELQQSKRDHPRSIHVAGTAGRSRPSNPVRSVSATSGHIRAEENPAPLLAPQSYNV